MFNLNLLQTFRPSRLRSFLLVGASFLVLSGCNTIRFYHDMDALRPQPDHRVPATALAWGLVPLEDPVELRSACPSGISKLEVQQEQTDAVIQVVTLGLVNRQVIRVWCKRRER